MNSVYTTNKDRTSKSKVYLWDCYSVGYDVDLLAPAASLTDLGTGEFVDVDNSGNLVRYTPSSNLPFGLTIGFPVDGQTYPAFAGHYDGKALVAHVSEETELFVRQIDASGNYVDATLKPNDPVKLVFNSTTKRWGVQLAQTGDTAQGRVIRKVKVEDLPASLGSYYTSGGETDDYLHIQLVRPFAIT